jgi:hypothetical protein
MRLLEILLEEEEEDEAEVGEVEEVERVPMGDGCWGWLMFWKRWKTDDGGSGSAYGIRRVVEVGCLGVGSWELGVRSAECGVEWARQGGRVPHSTVP